MCLKDNDTYLIGSNADNSDGVVAWRNRECEWFCDYSEFPVGYSHSKIKNINVMNMPLMWLSLKENHATPWASTVLYPTIC